MMGIGETERGGFDRLSLSGPWTEASGPWELINNTTPAQAELVEAFARTKGPNR
jgi:hypothetical protein